MKIKYFYQQFISHISVIVVAFLVLSLLFTQYMERIVYQNKADELITYGENILREFDRTVFGRENILNQYYNVLNDRDILFAVFDDKSSILYAGDWFITQDRLTEREWNLLKSGKIVEVRQDLKRFEQDVSLVAVPYFDNGAFIGGILLISPISGIREIISEMNQFLSIAVLIALAASLLLSSVLSYIHVKRITRIRKATSLVASGDYSVHLPSSTFDEIGELANDFNQMVKKLNDSMEEIKSLENRRRQFMSDVSHELRTPLTTIRGVIEGLKNDMIPEEKKEKGIQLVSQETNRLIRLVNENLDYDKIRSNQVTLFKVDIQLSEVMEIIKEQLQLQADEKNNQIIVDVEEGLIVHADYDRLIQILINITKNSIQFTDDGSIFLRGKSAENETIIEIEDTGIGIDPQEVEKIWDRFYRADISRKTNPYGEFGLGLSIVKQLVLLHNGKIDVTSEKGKGTKFVIRFPLIKSNSI
ncbi:MAG TPA: HAMP domain-containing sensor histidine kinase [Bacillus sp. (in: firmicutes)]|uniref:sensor histidine kinase n=1 Tax=Bacillus litorisediminis TaxID=2922713 RepID=UPI001FAD00A5|nr:HAMP domain-containing sensor histidine kinase [Bacillus litorisediminis]HWO76175.1 HAMP domain-containing sensor histidine kinase [Bacillus sp. (in: firmicutes)]